MSILGHTFTVLKLSSTLCPTNFLIYIQTESHTYIYITYKEIQTIGTVAKGANVNALAKYVQHNHVPINYFR